MGIGDENSTSVAGSTGPENVVWTTGSQGFLFLPLRTDSECPQEGSLGLQRRFSGLAHERRNVCCPLSGHASQDREIRAGLGRGEKGCPGYGWLWFLLSPLHWLLKREEGVDGRLGRSFSPILSVFLQVFCMHIFELLVEA